MKRTTAPFASLVLALSLLPLGAQAQIFSTNWTTGYFNSGDGYGPAGTASLDGAPTNAPSGQQWQTTDPFNGTNAGSTSLMTFVPGWTYDAVGVNNQSVYWGNYDPSAEFAPGEFGILPGVTNPVLYRQFALPGATDIVRWTADFGIVNLTPNGYSYLDTFGFDLLDATGANSLANFSFNPASATLQDLRLEWTLNGAVQTNNPAAPVPFEIDYGTLYRITATLQGSFFDLSMAGLVAQTNGSGTVTSYSVVTNVSIISGGALSGAFSAVDFGTAALNWELASANNLQPGPNYMILNTMSVENTVVPEPGTWAAAALLFGLTGLVLWRRKATSAAVSL
jgi:hypothetical protein